MTLHQMRRNYGDQGIDEGDVLPDPAAQFAQWFQDAQEDSPGDWFEVNAMTLATADATGYVTARIVLLKGFEEGCPIFFTNYSSQKGRQLEANPRAALCFYWPHCERSVRIEGTVERSTRQASEAYFACRPRGSQLGAIISEQTAVIPSREWLQQRLEVAERTYADQPIPCPPHWGGYRLVPRHYEFWQGRPNRLHDRIEYTREEPARPWSIRRLSP